MNKSINYFKILIIVLTIIQSNQIYAVNLGNNSNISEVEFTEIMFNPKGSDTGNEWIEIYSNNCINISRYRLYEDNISHKIYTNLELNISELQNFSVSDENSENFSKINICYKNCEILCGIGIISNNPQNIISTINSYYITANNPVKTNSLNNAIENNFSNNFSIYKSSFSLKNDGENLGIIKLGDNYENLLDYINYELLIKALNTSEGYSLEKIFLENTNYWTNSMNLNGTPGQINILNQNKINFNQNISENITNLEKIGSIEYNNTENVSENTQQINNSMKISMMINNSVINNSITINNSADNNHVNNLEKNVNVEYKCDIESKIILKDFKENNIYLNNNPIKFKNILVAKIYLEHKNSSENNTTNRDSLKPILLKQVEITNFSIEYWIEDIFGEVLKNKIITKNQDYKTYTPKIIEKDYFLIVKNNILEYNFEHIYKSEYETISFDKNNCKITYDKNEIILIIKNNNLTNYNSVKINTSKNAETTLTKNNIENMGFSKCLCNNSKNIIFPEIKILEVCSKVNSEESNQNNIEHVESINLNSKSNKDLANKANISINHNVHNISSDINITQKNNLITSAVIYESQVIKNKMYAVVLLVILILIFIGIIIYKHILINSKNQR